MTVTELSNLSNEVLIDLGAQLENELSALEAELRSTLQQSEGAQKQLLKPGVKLALSVSSGIAGIALAPITFGWSLVVTVVSSAVTLWDTVDYSPEAARFVSTRLRIRRLRMQADAILEELTDIDRLLTDRLSPP